MEVFQMISENLDLSQSNESSQRQTYRVKILATVGLFTERYSNFKVIITRAID